jgi:uncharacterized protein YuzB (UPF0349 family)
VLCRIFMLRLDDTGDAVERDVAAAGGEVEWTGCVSACVDCQKRIVGRVGGVPVVVDTAAELVAHVREMAAA